MNCVILGGKPLKGAVTVPSSLSENAALISLLSLSENFLPNFYLVQSEGVKNLLVAVDSICSKNTNKVSISNDFEMFYSIPILIKKFKEFIIEIEDSYLEEYKRFFDLLGIYFELIKKDTGFLCLLRDGVPEKISIDAKNFDLDAIIFVILLAIAINRPIIIFNYPKDPRFHSFGLAVKTLGGVVEIRDEPTPSISCFLTSPFLFAQKILPSYSLHKAAFFSLASLGTSGSINLININASEMLPLTMKINSYGGFVESNSPSHLLVRGQENIAPLEDSIEIRSYPGIIPSWGNLLLVFLSFYSLKSEIIFPRNNSCESLIKELNRLGANIDYNLSQELLFVKINQGNYKQGRKILLEERENILPLLLFALFERGRTTFVNFDIALSYYQDVIDLLRDCQADITDL
jgi:hypothetical protein